MSAFTPSPAPGTPSGLSGRRVAGYLLERELGRGGMAVVYQARDLRLERTVAVKLLSPQLALDDTFRRRFEHESRVAAALDHPHIVPVYEAGEADGVLYIAMRYVHGRDLAALLDRAGPLPSAQAVRITAQVGSALDAAHAHELVHRDVKPGNILLAEGTDPEHPEHVYLTDFGLTKKSLSLSGFTTVGQFVGTLDYVSPEQISGKPVDGRCDVYSLGCVVYEMLSGAPPFRRDDDFALLWAHQYDTPPALTSLRAQLPTAVDAVLARALAKTPQERYDSCLDLVSALRAAFAGPVPVAPGSPVAGHAPTRVVTAPRHGSDVEAGPGEPPVPPRWAWPVFAPGVDPHSHLHG
ncbi:serine/threonine protein kinase [Streptacidiphilus sp. MAP12-33]|uniref:serine/threonine-protein kinase n=1 Tax=Streptacidiphilus sp. MAP12-33 TaxID=3156266 RepID=UPI0035148839